MIPHSRTFLNNSDFQGVANALETGRLTAGSLAYQFQKGLTEYLKVEGTRLTVSGTMAFYRILLALDIGKDDEILMPDYICSSLVGPVRALGAKIIIYDNLQDSWLSSKEQISKMLSSKTKAVLINHTYGFPFTEIGELKSVLSNIPIIEDCCHILMPDVDNVKVGREGLCAFYSFNATKYLATGEGGAITSNNLDFLDRLDTTFLGDQLSSLNGALGLSQLKHLDNFFRRRRAIATEYLNQFSHFLPKNHLDLNGAYFRFPIRVNNQRDFFDSKKVSYRKGVDSLLSEKLNVRSMPNAKAQLETTISIPLYPSLRDAEVEDIVCETLRILNYGD